VFILAKSFTNHSSLLVSDQRVNFIFSYEMSVRPTLLKDLRRTAIQIHQQKTGTGNYNRYEPLTPRGRVFSTSKGQLESDDSTAETAAKAPKLDSNLVFEQLKGQDTVLSELDKALDDLGKAESEAPKDPRFDGLCKIVRLLATSQKNLTSALVDTVKVKTISAPETAKPPVDKTATQVKGKKPPPPPSPTKRLPSARLSRCSMTLRKRLCSLTWT
jgi:hypothetical protein